MTTIDKIEIEKFSKMAEDWWNPNGKFKPLHLFNPARIEFIKKKLISYFDLNSNSQKPLRKLKILDIGCGGGLLCEPLSKLGATITGIDPSKDNIEVAKLHSKEMNLNINYICCSPEKLNLENENERFKRREKEMIHEAKYLAKSIEDLSYAQKKKEYRKRILLDKWGEEVGHKINVGLIEIGFTEMMVEEALGHPDSINRTEYSFFIREQWVYNIGKYHYVYLEDGIVTAIQTKG